MQLNKSIKFFLNYFLGPVLFVVLAFSIYQQIIHQPQLEETWHNIRQSFFSGNFVYIVFAVLLIAVNWGLEAWKWMLLVNNIRPVRFLQAYKAVLSGVSFSVALPNRVGEYLGRMLYMPPGSKLKTISATIVGSMAQLIITLVTGFFGLVIIHAQLLKQYPRFFIWYYFIAYGVLFYLIVLLFLYFNVRGGVALIKRWVKARKYLYLVESLGNFNSAFLVRLLLISFVRYLVFLLQYLLIFKAFEVDVSITNLTLVMSVVFLALAVIPSVALIEIGLRGEISLKLLGIFTLNSLGVGLTTIAVWFLNLIIPALIGSLFLLNIKLTNKNVSD